MLQRALPEPTKQHINWFYEKDQKGTLRINPKYQRNPIWSQGQKCFLIDSILSDTPIPQVYLNLLSEKKGTVRRTIYEVVDGQQRLRAILEFLRDEYPLAESTGKVYKVSPIYHKLVGKTFSELSEELQEKVWNYPIPVQELRSYSQDEVRDTFRRLNSVVERLNKQELRHSQYFGEFAKLVDELAQHQFWLKSKVIRRGDLRRMKDAEFVSELLLVVIDGIQDRQTTLDEYYAAYDTEFPQKHRVKAKFLANLTELEQITDLIRDTRFNKKADFYALFAAVNQLGDKAGKKLVTASKKLQDLSDELDRPSEELSGTPLLYHSTVIEGGGKLTNRKQRMDILLKIIDR
jgi:hypothetical protein